MSSLLLCSIASAMLFKSIARELESIIVQLIPQRIRDQLVSNFSSALGKLYSSETTLIIDEHSNGNVSLNEVYQASHLYLQDKISPWNQKLKVAKSHGDNKLSVAVNEGEEITDSYQGIMLKWVMVCTESQKKSKSVLSESHSILEKKSFNLSFSKEHREVILLSYLPHVMEVANARKEPNKIVKLHSLSLGGGVHWRSTNLNHPSTFDTLAMDPTEKEAIMADLDRFVRRRDFYRRVGKAWKRGYLLYGPPGTGKSSLIAAMANHYKLNIYNVELTGIRDDPSLISLLMSTHNRSMIVIEDIDCSVQLQNRKTEDNPQGRSNKFTLSGLLNFIDGLWSSCGDQRIIVFTTNQKEKLEPALLRPGRMDMHIHMSYLTPAGFRVLAMNYLGISSHPLFSQIEHLISDLEITTAAVAEELMKDDDDPNNTLELLLEFLQKKKPTEVVCKSVVEMKINHRKKLGNVEHEAKVKGVKTRVKEI